MVGIDVHDPRPAREQIAARIRDRITTGELHVGDRLPPTRELAEQYRTSNQTITEAIRLLRAEHLVVSRAGTGVFVADPERLPRIPADNAADVTGQIRALQSQVEEVAVQLSEVRDLLRSFVGESGREARRTR